MAASLFAWLFNFVELTCLPAALKALILHSFFLFSYVNALKREAFFYPWDTVPGAQWAFLNTVSGAEMTTLVLSATEPVRNALPPTTECSPITVSPPRMDAPE